MDKRLKIVTIAVSLIFAVITYQTMRDMAEGFIDGFREGYEGARNEARGFPVTRTFHLSLKPEGGRFTFPTTTVPSTSLLQLSMKKEIRKMCVQVTYVKEQIPPKLRVAENSFGFFIIFFVLYAIVIIPIQVFRIVRSITKNKIFDFTNIKRLRMVGYALLVIYIADLVMRYLEYKIASHVVHIEGYTLQMGSGNLTLVMLGFVVLMFAEVLKISVPLKEEQDLTV
ncbi:MAG: DUF2975 domain-containing protein [Bacteroidales bacterium]|nr:DUF2975 domain-containing protein [Bacteroidales bacterium]